MKRLIDPTTIQEVIPNPAGEATETLSKLGVNGKVYGVGGGGSESKLYLHKLYINDTPASGPGEGTHMLMMSVISSSMTPFTSFDDIVANLDKLYLTPTYLISLTGVSGECGGLLMGILEPTEGAYTVSVVGGSTMLSTVCLEDEEVDDTVVELSLV